MDETLRAMDDLVRSGKVRYIGCSNWAGWQLAKSVGRARLMGLHEFISQQIQYSLVAREVEHELIPAGLDHGIGALVWSPLGMGYLTGKYRQAAAEDSRLMKMGRLHLVDSEKNRAIVDALDEIGQGLGANAGQVALAWLLRKPGVASVILGAKSEEQLADNLKAATLRLADEQMARLDELSAVPEPYPMTHHHTSAKHRNPLPPQWID
jgi:aryl-alcohol dehydrogenase-like predicted oxidoreductase